MRGDNVINTIKLVTSGKPVRGHKSLEFLPHTLCVFPSTCNLVKAFQLDYCNLKNLSLSIAWSRLSACFVFSVCCYYFSYLFWLSSSLFCRFHFVTVIRNTTESARHTKSSVYLLSEYIYIHNWGFFFV